MKNWMEGKEYKNENVYMLSNDRIKKEKEKEKKTKLEKRIHFVW